MGQLVDELKPQFEKKINFLVIFADKQQEQPVAEKYKVKYVPLTILFDKNGVEQKNYTGQVVKDTLVQKLKDLAK